jgi:hypothetical protein
MQHLLIPAKLQKNIESVHNQGTWFMHRSASLKALHDNVAAFILAAESPKPTKNGGLKFLGG